MGEGAPGEGGLRGFRAGLQHSPDPKPEPVEGGSSREKRPPCLLVSQGQQAPEVTAATPPHTPIQGDTPRQRAEKAQDTELAAYLENRQHYQMIQREDQETAV